MKGCTIYDYDLHEEGIFIVLHRLWHWTSVFYGLVRRNAYF